MHEDVGHVHAQVIQDNVHVTLGAVYYKSSLQPVGEELLVFELSSSNIYATVEAVSHQEFGRTDCIEVSYWIPGSTFGRECRQLDRWAHRATVDLDRVQE